MGMGHTTNKTKHSYHTIFISTTTTIIIIIIHITYSVSHQCLPAQGVVRAVWEVREERGWGRKGQFSTMLNISGYV